MSAMIKFTNEEIRMAEATIMFYVRLRNEKVILN